MRVTLTAEAVQMLERLSGLPAESKLLVENHSLIHWWSERDLLAGRRSALQTIDQFEFNSMVIAALERLDGRLGSTDT